MLRFLSSLVIFSLLTTQTVHAQGTCGTLRVRREVRDLSPQEFDRYAAALRQLNEKNGDGISEYDQLVRLHSSNAREAHG